MSQLLLLGNPARRRRRKSSKRASPAQRAARARFAAMARARSHTKRRRSRTITLAANPAPARRRRTRRAAIRHHARRAHHAVSASLRGVMPMVKDSAVGAAGAIGVDVLYGFLQQYLPASMTQSGGTMQVMGVNPIYVLSKGAAAVALGTLGKRILGRNAGKIVEGSLTVTLHETMKTMLASSGVNLTLGYMPGGQVLPPLPMSQSLRGTGSRHGTLGMYAGSGTTLGMYASSTATRENLLR